LKSLLENGAKKLKLSLPETIKGVEGLLNKYGVSENILKGIIRAFHNIFIFKDGTTRVDITNAPLHQFRVKDIHITVDKARELGYDVNDEEDILDLYIQDIIIPYSAAKYLVKVCKYIDSLLLKVYGLDSYYNVKKISDLVGKIVVGLSPHTSVGVIGRIIGFTKSSVLYAHPLWHAAKRRDCDGDEDSIMLLLDVLINFSKEYLPSGSGGRMDAPLYINIVLHPEEVDTQAHNMDSTKIYPKEFYELTHQGISPKEIVEKRIIQLVNDNLFNDKKYSNYFSFKYPGILELKENTSLYSKLGSMKKKLDKQMEIMRMIFNDDELSIIIHSILTKHVLPDIIGNLRSFTSQSFRCKRCNKIHRRPPLSGKCTKCGGELIQTVYPKNVIKYLDLAKILLKHVKSDNYLVNRIELIEKEIQQTISGVAIRKRLTDFL
jgi:DNA polymerase II large subunit